MGYPRSGWFFERVRTRMKVKEMTFALVQKSAQRVRGLVKSRSLPPGNLHQCQKMGGAAKGVCMNMETKDDHFANVGEDCCLFGLERRGWGKRAATLFQHDAARGGASFAGLKSPALHVILGVQKNGNGAEALQRRSDSTVRELASGKAEWRQGHQRAGQARRRQRPPGGFRRTCRSMRVRWLRRDWRRRWMP